MKEESISLRKKFNDSNWINVKTNYEGPVSLLIVYFNRVLIWSNWSFWLIKIVGNSRKKQFYKIVVCYRDENDLIFEK